MKYCFLLLAVIIVDPLGQKTERQNTIGMFHSTTPAECRPPSLPSIKNWMNTWIDHPSSSPRTGYTTKLMLTHMLGFTLARGFTRFYMYQFRWSLTLQHAKPCPSGFIGNLESWILDWDSKTGGVQRNHCLTTYGNENFRGWIAGSTLIPNVDKWYMKARSKHARSKHARSKQIASATGTRTLILLASLNATA